MLCKALIEVKAYRQLEKEVVISTRLSFDLRFSSGQAKPGWAANT